jgi:hypothetical protein
VAAALEGGNAGPAIIPGKSAASPLILSLTGDGDIRRMPPRGRGLSATQVALLKRWIDEGARAPAQEKPGRAERPGRQKRDDDDDDRERDRGFRKKWREREREGEKNRRKREKPEKDDD